MMNHSVMLVHYLVCNLDSNQRGTHEVATLSLLWLLLNSLRTLRYYRRMFKNLPNILDKNDLV